MKRIIGILLLVILAVGTTSCETRKETESRMAEITGNYRLARFYSVANIDRINEIPQAELDAATARIFPNGKGWVFEYTLPFASSDGSGFSYHRVRQTILWDPQLGQYCFYQLEASDFAGLGIDPAYVTMSIGDGEIKFIYSPRKYTCVWDIIR